MIIASNTSPLIALSKINQLVILTQLFEQILIPQIVVDEFFVNCLNIESDIFTNFCQLDSVTVVNVHIDNVFSRHLGMGEQSVLSLAL